MRLLESCREDVGMRLLESCREDLGMRLLESCREDLDVGNLCEEEEEEEEEEAAFLAGWGTAGTELGGLTADSTGLCSRASSVLGGGC